MRALLPLLLLFVALACKEAPGGDSAPQPDRAATDVPTDDAPKESGEDELPVETAIRPPRVLFLGTSLTAGFGLSEEEAYPARLAGMLAERGHPIEAVNAGVSGDTSAGGLERLDWLLREPPAVLVLELGANAGLRGLPAAMTEANLLEAVARAEASGARVIVAGMMMPPNYGEDYARAFAAVFPRVADETGSDLIPFLLEAVAGDRELNLPDGIHPNAEGHERIAATVLPHLLEALSRGS